MSVSEIFSPQYWAEFLVEISLSADISACICITHVLDNYASTLPGLLNFAPYDSLQRLFWCQRARSFPMDCLRETRVIPVSLVVILGNI